MLPSPALTRTFVGGSNKPSPKARQASFSEGTIRTRIFLAFLAMSIITGALGGYAMIGIDRAGGLVTKMFDHSLMSINYARAAAADFASMRAVVARWQSNGDEAARQKLDAQFAALEACLAEDLGIAAERSQSQRAKAAAAKVQQAVEAWKETYHTTRAGTAPESDRNLLDHYSEVVDQQIDLLINYTAGDAFTSRQSARAAVDNDTRLNLAGTILAVLLSGGVAWLLSRRIIGRVAAASAIAERIAAGNLGGDIPRGGADELGALLGAMAVMRDNIRAMMDNEVAQRRSAQTRLADALQTSNEGVVVLDAQGCIVSANARAADFLGVPVENFLGVPVETWRDGTDIGQLRACGQDEIGSTLGLFPGTPAQTSEVRLPDGRWVRVSRNVTQDEGAIVVYSDISLLKQQEASLKSTNIRLDLALDNMSHGLCLFDAQSRLQVVNRRFCQIFSLSPDVVTPGMAVEDVLALSVAAGNHPGKTASDLLANRAEWQARGAADTRLEEIKDGRIVAIKQQSTSDGGWVATYEDVTERRLAEERVAYLARHDVLTGLPNRAFFGDRIDVALAQLGRGQSFAVLCLDLDNFKQINDTLGHPVGDELLQAVAERLKACVREVDTVARLGGDEFAIIQWGAKKPDEAALLARRIVEVVSEPYQLREHRVTTGVSIGLSLAPGDGSTCDKLLKNADVALYRAKADGRGIWRFFEAEMDARLQARRALELDLHDALARDEFELFFQPVFDLRAERVGGFEALLRWRHPTRGLVPPSEFIPVAEEIGLIGSLGEWVLHRACAEARGWPSKMKVAVNVSPAQFLGRRLGAAVGEAIATSGLDPERLELEITESVLLSNSQATLDTLHGLRELGIHVSMDDFGTGYSSLSYLRRFPFDKIKIDQSFIRGGADGSGMIVRAIISLSASLGMRTTAEGVETEEQLTRLRAQGCDEAQGYLFSPPIPASEVASFIERSGSHCRAGRAQKLHLIR